MITNESVGVARILMVILGQAAEHYKNTVLHRLMTRALRAHALQTKQENV